MSLFLSGEDVYGRFIFSRCSESSVIKGPHTETTTRARTTVKIALKDPSGLNRAHKLLLLLQGHSTPFSPICSSGPVFWSTLWTEGIKSMPGFVFTRWSASCNYLNKRSFLTLGEELTKSYITGDTWRQSDKSEVTTGMTLGVIWQNQKTWLL